MFSPRRYTCALKRANGKDFCLSECPARDPRVYDYARIEQAGDIPPADPLVIDVAVLDMNHGWPNLGHDSLVHVIKDAACDLAGVLAESGLRIRALSYEVRRRHMIPEPPGGRFAVYLGTGGPGHLDPRLNHPRFEGSQGLEEDPGWEGPLFALFDRIRESEEAALIAVCHSFGVMCRWSGAARPVLRSAAKGGKSAGVQENVLTEDAARHPWFGQFADEVPDHRRVRIVDHRLFDLIPGDALPPGLTPIGYETRGVEGRTGELHPRASARARRSGLEDLRAADRERLLDEGRRLRQRSAPPISWSTPTSASRTTCVRFWRAWWTARASMNSRNATARRW